MAILGVLMYAQGLQSSAQEAGLQTQASATTTADRIEQWISASPRPTSPSWRARPPRRPAGRDRSARHFENATDPAFESIALVNAAGTVIALTAENADLKAVGQAAWFGQALYIATEHPITNGATGLVWIITAPIVGAERRLAGRSRRRS